MSIKRPEFQLGEEFYFFPQNPTDVKKYFIRQIQQVLKGSERYVEYVIDLTQHKRDVEPSKFSITISKEELEKTSSRLELTNLNTIMDTLHFTLSAEFPVILDIKTKMACLESIYYAEKRGEYNPPRLSKKGGRKC